MTGQRPGKSWEIQSRGEHAPNQLLQQAGHATEGFFEFNAAFRVSRLLSLVVRLQRIVAWTQHDCLKSSERCIV
jgi:hypothetical protein